MFDSYTNIVSTRNAVKEKWIQIRIAEDIKADFMKVAELRGLSYSALLHSMIVKVIREEKELSPRSFETSPIIRAGGLPVAARSKSSGIPLISPKNTERRKVNEIPKKKTKRVA